MSRAYGLLGAGRAEMVDVPRPEPGPDEVLLRVLAAGVCRTDLARLDFAAEIGADDGIAAGPGAAEDVLAANAGRVLGDLDAGNVLGRRARALRKGESHVVSCDRTD